MECLEFGYWLLKNMKIIFWFRTVPLLVIFLGFFVAYKMSWQGGDFSIFSIDGERVELVNISPGRGMVNSYEIKDTDIWIPNGMGWYPVLRLGLIVKDDIELVKKVSFYNFGFWPNEVVLSGRWNKNSFLFSVLGPVGWLRYRLSVSEWLWKSETLKMDSLSEVISRDMSDSKILASDIKINIVNASGKNGFGNMMADRLEYWGLTVTSVQTGNLEKQCQLYFDFATENKKILDDLASILNCNKVNQTGLAELVLGTDSEEMIKYSQTYVRSL